MYILLSFFPAILALDAYAATADCANRAVQWEIGPNNDVHVAQVQCDNVANPSSHHISARQEGSNVCGASCAYLVFALACFPLCFGHWYLRRYQDHCSVASLVD